jgi:hypothetical protein
MKSATIALLITFASSVAPAFAQYPYAHSWDQFRQNRKASPRAPLTPEEAQTRRIKLQIAEKKTAILQDSMKRVAAARRKFSDDLRMNSGSDFRTRYQDALRTMKMAEKEINTSCQQQLAAIDDFARELNPNFDSGTANIHCTPLGSNLYVRNYVNYVGDPQPQPEPEQLKAVAGRLGAKRNSK